MVLVGDRVVIEHVSVGRCDDLFFALFPDEAWGQFVIAHQAVKLVVTELRGVIREVRQGVIDLATHQILTVIQARRSGADNHTLIIRDFSLLRKSYKCYIGIQKRCIKPYMMTSGTSSTAGDILRTYPNRAVT